MRKIWCGLVCVGFLSACTGDADGGGDGDSQEVLVEHAALLVDEGSTGSLEVKLAFAPEADVVVSVVSALTDKVAVSPATLTFTSSNFDLTQSVALTLPEDDDASSETVDVTFSATELADVVVPVMVADNDVQGIALSPGALTVTESGATDSFTVRLNQMPSATITVNVASSDLSAATVAPATLTFTAADYMTEQTVTVTAVSDPDTFPGTTAIDVTSDGLQSRSVPVSVVDDDTQFHLVSTATLTVREEDPTGQSFTVALSSQPLASVTVNLSAPSLLLSTATLTFLPGNFDIAQSVTVRGKTDPNLVDELVDITISSSVAPSETVTVLVEEDDLQDLVVSPPQYVQPAGSGLPVIEDATVPATVSVRLQFQPEGTKGVRVRSNNNSVLLNGQLFVDLLFTTTNYATPQVLNVTTPTDNNLDQPVDTTLTVGLCDAACNSAVFTAVKTVNVDAEEDDVQSIIATPTFVSLVEGGFETFTVHLAFEPLAFNDEIVSVTSSDPQTATAAAMSPPLLFNAGNYNVPQSVTVTGVEDVDVLSETIQITLRSSVPPTPDVIVDAFVADND